jgi:hypothetical protein
MTRFFQPKLEFTLIAALSTKTGSGEFAKPEIISP